MESLAKKEEIVKVGMRFTDASILQCWFGSCYESFLDIAEVAWTWYALGRLNIIKLHQIAHT